MTDMPMIKMMATVTSSRMMPPTTMETAATMVVKDPPVPATMAGVVYVGVYVAAARLPLTQNIHYCVCSDVYSGTPQIHRPTNIS